MYGENSMSEFSIPASSGSIHADAVNLSKLVTWQIAAFDYNKNTTLCYFFKKHTQGYPSSYSNEGGKPQIVMMTAKYMWYAENYFQ